MNCAVCNSILGFRWTDTHGIGVCSTCGNPYRIYHYDENGEPVEKPPEPMLNDAGLALAKAYWDENKRMVFPGCFDVGFFSNRDHTYSGASRKDIEHWNLWYDNNAEKVNNARIEAGEEAENAGK